MSSVPVWQPDESAKSCPLCHHDFKLWYRRHHCRKCGRVVCAGCSGNSVRYLATTYVVSPPGRIYLESPLIPHRTCNECVRELEMMNEIENVESVVRSVPLVQEEMSRCPICDTLLVHMSEQEQDSHVETCISEYGHSPPSTWRNRMIVYKLPEKEMTLNLGECAICFEDFEGGQTVGRLECLCVFHDECILKWFHKKGAGKCPVHNPNDWTIVMPVQELCALFLSTNLFYYF